MIIVLNNNYTLNCKETGKILSLQLKVWEKQTENSEIVFQMWPDPSSIQTCWAEGSVFSAQQRHIFTSRWQHLKQRAELWCSEEEINVQALLGNEEKLEEEKIVCSDPKCFTTMQNLNEPQGLLQSVSMVMSEEDAASAVLSPLQDVMSLVSWVEGLGLVLGAGKLGFRILSCCW